MSIIYIYSICNNKYSNKHIVNSLNNSPTTIIYSISYKNSIYLYILLLCILSIFIIIINKFINFILC